MRLRPAATVNIRRMAAKNTKHEQKTAGEALTVK